MKKILIIGAGGHSNVIEDTLIELGFFNEIAYLDDKFNDSNKNIIFRKQKNIIGTSN